MKNSSRHPSSFRDPSGNIFVEDGVIRRYISPFYFKQYITLRDQGFFNKLFKAGLLIEHRELTNTDSAIIIEPEQISFITYPYEWSFNQYKEAALLTLKLQKYCLENDFSLKDASAFNVTFHKGQAIFIDTLSFDFYERDVPWRGYKQFISHFLGPLILAHFHGAQSLKLMSNFIDGIPIKMLSSMLPLKTKLSPFIYSNIHLLARFEEKHSEGVSQKVSSLSKKGQLNIIKSIYGYIKKLSLNETSEWGDYYSKTNYSKQAFQQKSKVINTWIGELGAKVLIDIGGNDGTFVRQIGHELDVALVCDIDNNAIDVNYRLIKERRESNILPFVLDVLNPSASIGFNNNERASFLDRIKKFAPDVALALAVIHHMTLSGNIPFQMSAQFFASFSKYLIIEFPKRKDSYVEKLLESKREFKNHFDFYNIKNFNREYSAYFKTIDKLNIGDSERVLFLLKRKEDV